MLNINITANEDGGIGSISIHGTKAEKQAVITGNFIQATPVLASRFIDNGDGTITDQESNLQWSKDDISTKELKHAAAEKACKELSLADHKDWRLPTRKELASLVDDTRYKPAIDTAIFPSCKSAWYWTQTPDASDPEVCAWIVAFSSGSVYLHGRSYPACVRAVRSVSPPSQ